MMFYNHKRITQVAIVTCVVLVNRSLFAQPVSRPANAVEALAAEHAISAEGVQGLIGQTADILSTTGAKQVGVTISSIGTSRSGDRVKIIGYKGEGSKREKKIPALKLYQITVDGKTYRANYIPSAKGAALQDMAKLEEEVQTRLSSQGERLWKKYTDEEIGGFIKEEKEFLQEVGEHFTNLPMKYYETNYFMFFTDLPPNQVAPYLKNLDKMNEILGKAYGFAPGENVWRGKAVILAFVNKASFQEFEAKFMNNGDTGSAMGLCHSSSNGRVVVSCYRGDSPSYFAALLVHETSHGYTHRFMSTVHIPSWVNEGIAEWVASAAVPGERSMRNRQQLAATQLKQLGSLNGMLSSERVQGQEGYGASLSLINLLIKENPAQFRAFFNGIKQGLPWEDSLMRAYGASPEDLAKLYGRSIGVPNLGL